jgi:hypothetical protein
MDTGKKKEEKKKMEICPIAAREIGREREGEGERGRKREA